MNNNTFDVSSLVFKTGNQKKFTKMKPFHTKINLMNITGEIFISIIDLINFLNKLPNVHTHTELHEMMATPSFHFRSVL